MIFSLDVRRARKGDCLLLHFGTKDDARPGPDRWWAERVSTRRISGRASTQIREARELADEHAAARRPADGQPRRRRPHPGHPRADEDELHREGRADGRCSLKVLELLAQQLRRHHRQQAGRVDRGGQRLSSARPSTGGAAAGRPTLEVDDEAHRRRRSVTAQPEGPGQHRAGLPAASQTPRRSDFRANPEFGGKLIIAREGATPVERRARSDLHRGRADAARARGAAHEAPGMAEGAAARGQIATGGARGLRRQVGPEPVEHRRARRGRRQDACC